MVGGVVPTAHLEFLFFLPIYQTNIGCCGSCYGKDIHLTTVRLRGKEDKKRKSKTINEERSYVEIRSF